MSKMENLSLSMNTLGIATLLKTLKQAMKSPFHLLRSKSPSNRNKKRANSCVKLFPK
jgi:hypothetical protein